MTLLSIANDVASETQGARPVSIAGSTEPDAQLILRLINKVGIRLMETYAWSELRKEQSFTSVAGADQTNAIPSDFDRFIPETFWNRSSSLLMTGPISPTEWNSLQTYDFNTNNPKFIYRGGAVSVTPVLGAGETLAFEYVSKNWCTDAAGTTFKTKFTADTDLSLLDEDLITSITVFEWLKANSQPYGEAMQDAKDNLDRLTRNDSPSENIAAVGDIFAINSRVFDGTPRANQSYFGGIS
jgi:hypothetical protein